MFKILLLTFDAPAAAENVFTLILLFMMIYLRWMMMIYVVVNLHVILSLVKPTQFSGRCITNTRLEILAKNPMPDVAMSDRLQ